MHLSYSFRLYRLTYGYTRMLSYHKGFVQQPIGALFNLLSLQYDRISIQTNLLHFDAFCIAYTLFKILVPQRTTRFLIKACSIMYT